MSMTITVPAPVPSLFHSSSPCAPSSAVKKRVLPTARRFEGSEESTPGRMSATCTVPARVPLLLQSSVPVIVLVLEPSCAVKKSVPLTLVRLLGLELEPPGKMSFTSNVPAVVPSLLHSSVPVPDCHATKKSVRRP